MTPQAKKIYTYMMKGNRMDRKIAMAVFDVQNLTARISELRKEGVSFFKFFPDGRSATYLMDGYDRHLNFIFNNDHD